MLVFFFNDTATTEIYTLSLHDALPILHQAPAHLLDPRLPSVLHQPREGLSPEGLRAARGITHAPRQRPGEPAAADRKSTRLNSSHANISYAVFCLKKKNTSYSASRASE